MRGDPDFAHRPRSQRPRLACWAVSHSLGSQGQARPCHSLLTHSFHSMNWQSLSNTSAPIQHLALEHQQAPHLPQPTSPQFKKSHSYLYNSLRKKSFLLVWPNQAHSWLLEQEVGESFSVWAFCWYLCKSL
jgi:hypothetical protein